MDDQISGVVLPIGNQSGRRLFVMNLTIDSMKQRRSYSLTLLATCALLAAPAHMSFGQSNLASVNGVVRDPSGAVIPDAKITLRNEATAVEVKTTTSAAGNYSIPSVPAGTYTLIAESSGFKRFEQSRNIVVSNVTATIDV